MKKQNGGIVFDRRGWIRITSAEIVLFCHAIKAGKVCGTSAYISAAWLSVAMQRSWLLATNTLNLLMRCSAEETGNPRVGTLAGRQRGCRARRRNAEPPRLILSLGISP